MEWDQVQKPDLDGQKECKSHRKEYFRMDADLPDKKSWKNGIRNAAESASSLDRKRFTRKRIPHKKTKCRAKMPSSSGRPAASGKRAYGNPCLKRYQQPSENSFLLMQYPAISFLFPKAQETASPLERRSMPFSRESTWDWLTSTERWHLIKRSPSSSCA